jgi:hypothetical protein
MTTMTHQSLRSGDQTVHFDGELLSSASSEYGYQGARKPRWTVIEIYRTDDGKYVVSKIGRSRVVHSTMDCGVLKNNEDPMAEVDVGAGFGGFAPCPRCWRRGELSGVGFLENDHAAASIADRPEGAVAACHSRDQNGLWSLSWLAEDALQDACEADPDLMAAFKDFDIGSLGRRSR